MGYLEAVVLAVLQGLTEFLPVSSSGHLILAQQWLGGLGNVDLFYDVLLHLATALAVLVYLRRDVWQLARGALSPGEAGEGPFAGQERRMVGFLALATVPTGLVGLALDRWAFAWLTRPDVVGAMLMLTAVILWWGRRPAGVQPRDMRSVDALGIGVLQGLAVTPGISRSGLTIAAALRMGLHRKVAARFSLLVSIPAILGATLLKGLDALEEPLPPVGPYLVRMLIAFLVGYASIAMILRMVQQQRFHWFSWYVGPLGALVILWYHLA